MRSTWMPLLACALIAAAPPPRARDLPYQGKWKITVLDPRFELSVWVVEIDRQAKDVKVLWGLAQFSRFTPANVKTDAKSLTFDLTAGPNLYRFFVQPPGKARTRLLGCVRAGANTLPVWLDRTDKTELDEKGALRQLSGAADLVEVGKQTDPRERVQGLQEIIKKYPDRPIAHLASQALIGQLAGAKADAKALESAIAAYIDLVTPHGPPLVLHARLNVAQTLVNRAERAALAVENARLAAKLLRADDAPSLQMSVQLTLAAALYQAGKADEVKPVAVALRKLADDVIKGVKGADAEFTATGEMGRLLLSSRAPAVADVGLEYARKVVGLVKDDSPLPNRLAAYKLLARGLEVRGKKDEAAPLLARIDKLEGEQDQEYLKKSVPFEVEKYTGRKARSDRVVLVELFTNAHNPLCPASDVAFDAVRRVYPAKDVVFVQYHTHVPAPDPLTNADSEARKTFYGSDLDDIPGVLVDGKTTVALGGERKRAKVSYENLRDAIDKALEAEAEAKVALSVSRKGDTIEAKATVSDVKMAGAAMKLRFGLVEEVVRYPGQNGQRLHFHVLRALIGGANGFALDRKEGAHTASVTVPAVSKALEDYLTAFGKKNNVQWNDRPTALKKLKVIAWVQDDDSKKVYQAAQAEVPE